MVNLSEFGDEKFFFEIHMITFEYKDQRSQSFLHSAMIHLKA